MPTFNKVDMMNCCRGWHDFSDGATECHVCGAGEEEASAPNATGLERHHGMVQPPSPSMIAPADPVRDAAPDMLAALKEAASSLDEMIREARALGWGDSSTETTAMAALQSVRDAIAKAEGAA